MSRHTKAILHQGLELAVSALGSGETPELYGQICVHKAAHLALALAIQEAP